MGINNLSPAEIEELIQTVAVRVAARLSEDSAGSKKGDASDKADLPLPCPLASTGECGGCGDCAEKNPEAVQNIIEAGADRIGSCNPGSNTQKIAPFIDHTLLKPNATDDQIEALCKEAIEHGFASVCVNSGYVSLSSRLLAGSPIKVCTVVGFPLGAMSSEAKAFETRDAVAKGADEIDMVINVGKLKSEDYEYILQDICSVVRAAQGRCVKVILETASLTDEQKVAGCILAKAAGAGYVKTSTGFGSGGATVQDVALMRRVVGSKMGVKAAGGIRTAETAREMIAAGASRIGASASVSIVKGNG